MLHAFNSQNKHAKHKSTFIAFVRTALLAEGSVFFLGECFFLFCVIIQWLLKRKKKKRVQDGTKNTKLKVSLRKTDASLKRKG